MNEKVEVTWITLCTVSHSLMINARVQEEYIHFALMYTTDHIFPVLPIKYLINKDGDPTMPYKLATGTKPSLSHLRMLFCPCVVRKANVHVAGLNGVVRSPSSFIILLIGRTRNI